jgi:hypothetical protein
MFPIASIAGNVLILDDDYGTEVSDDLISRGHTVTSVPHYDWDGTNPAPTGFDLILATTSLMQRRRVQHCRTLYR